MSTPPKPTPPTNPETSPDDDSALADEEDLVPVTSTSSHHSNKNNAAVGFGIAILGILFSMVIYHVELLVISTSLAINKLGM